MHKKGSRTNLQGAKSAETEERLCKEEIQDRKRDVNFTMQFVAHAGKRQRFRSSQEMTDPYTAVIASQR